MLCGPGEDAPVRVVEVKVSYYDVVARVSSDGMRLEVGGGNKAKTHFLTILLSKFYSIELQRLKADHFSCHSYCADIPTRDECGQAS